MGVSGTTSIPVIRKCVRPCGCGSHTFNLEYGEPIQCVECDSIPNEITATCLEEPAKYVLHIEQGSGPTRIQSLGSVVYY